MADINKYRTHNERSTSSIYMKVAKVQSYRQ